MDFISGGLPANPFSLVELVEKLKAAYLATTGGKFAEALSLFTNIIHAIPFLIVSNKQEVMEVCNIKKYLL